MFISHGLRRDDAMERRLRLEVDDRLRLRWNDRRERWVIYRISHLNSKWDPLRTLEDAVTGEHIPLDGRIIEQALLGDTWRRPRGVLDILDEMQAENQAKIESRERDRRAAAEDMAHSLELNARNKVYSFGGKS